MCLYSLRQTMMDEVLSDQGCLELEPLLFGVTQHKFEQMEKCC
jgi:hypothetical protein